MICLKAAMHKQKLEIKFIYIVLVLFFGVFLCAPLLILLLNSFQSGQNVGFANYITVVGDKDIFLAIQHSIYISALTAFITTSLAFVLAYAVNCTNIHKLLKLIIRIGILIPMLLPTITYGFAIIYSFGKQGLLTHFFCRELFFSINSFFCNCIFKCTFTFAFTISGSNVLKK